MSDNEKRSPQEIVAAIRETVRTLNEHLEEAAEAGLSVTIDSMRLMKIPPHGHDVVTADCFLKL